jgi:ACS family hexuronate transporter-like MFS transporter
MTFKLDRRFLLGLLIVASILNYADRQIIAILKPVLQEDLHWTDADYGHLAATFQLSAAIAFLFTGWFTDRVGLKVANPLAVGSWSLAAMAHGLASTVTQFTFARVALGATEALGTPTGIKTIATVFDAKSRSLALGLLNAAGNLGAVVTPLFVPFLAAAVGWRNTFAIVGGAGLIWVVVWYASGASKAVAAHATPASTPTLAAEVGEAVPPAAPAKVRWRDVFSDRATWAVMGGKALFDQVWWFLLFWTPDLFHRVFGLSMKEFAIPLACIYLIAASGSLTVGFVVNRLLARGWTINRARKTVMLVCALLVTPVPLVLLAPNPWVAVALLGLTLAAHQGFSVNVFGIITDVVPAQRVGTTTSLGAFAGNLSGMAVLQLAGMLLSSGAGYLPLFLMASCAYLLALAWIHLWLPTLRLANL